MCKARYAALVFNESQSKHLSSFDDGLTQGQIDAKKSAAARLERIQSLIGKCKTAGEMQTICTMIKTALTLYDRADETHTADNMDVDEISQLSRALKRATIEPDPPLKKNKRLFF
jgi:hypothetical protein